MLQLHSQASKVVEREKKNGRILSDGILLTLFIYTVNYRFIHNEKYDLSVNNVIEYK